jgi:hypothetical protein
MKILWLGYEQNLVLQNHDILLMNRETFSMDIAKMFKPDLIIEREFNDNKSFYSEEIKELKKTFPHCKTAVWLIDTHVAFTRHLTYAKNFDYIFLAISAFVPMFKQHFKNVYWLPLCFPQQMLPPLQKWEYEIGFVGRVIPEMQKRKELLEALKHEFKDKCHFVVDYETVYDTMARCKIMVNYSIVNDLNFRVFEALACGNILITNVVPDLDNIPGLSDRLMFFYTIEGALKHVKEALKVHNDEQTQKFLEDNRNFIQQNHTLTNRVNELLSVIYTHV